MLTVLALSGIARANSDFQSWNNIAMIGSLKNKLKYWFEAQGRFGDDASRLSQSIIRPGIGYEIDSQNSIWAGYAWIYTNRPFAATGTDEQRIWQQYLWNKDFNWIKTFSRTRLEQRFIENVSTAGWRLRQFGRVQLPIGAHRQFFVAATEELFIKLNNTAKSGSNKGFDQNRLFVGVGGYPLKNWLFEMGYQNHIINSHNGPNYHGNYIAMNLVGNLG